MKHIHFVGINGSGISGAACIAAAKGFKVSGCDCKESSNYSGQFSAMGIYPKVGHNVKHISSDVDRVVITPHFLYKDMYKNVEELVKAKEKGLLMKWQHFLGEYVMAGMNTIAVCGTHGKTTTTSLIGLVLEKSGVDPTVLVGGVVPEWDRTFRNGNSDIFVIEADEYDNNFINYNPKNIVFHTLEMEHPEIFNSFDEYKNVFVNFLKTIREEGVLFFNLDSDKVCNVVEDLRDFFENKKIKLIGYGIDNCDFKCDKMYLAKNITFKNGLEFYIGNDEIYSKLIGTHNVYNLLSSYAVGREIAGENLNFQDAIETFGGAKRRLEIVYEDEKLVLYNDYAHHHNQVKSNLEALRSAYDNVNIISVFEPHQITRLVDNVSEYMEGLDISDYFYITKVFKGREKDKPTPDIDKMIKEYKNKARYEVDNEELLNSLLKDISESEKRTVVLVMGAGEAYKITESLVEILKNKAC